MLARERTLTVRVLGDAAGVKRAFGDVERSAGRLGGIGRRFDRTFGKPMRGVFSTVAGSAATALVGVGASLTVTAMAKKAVGDYQTVGREVAALARVTGLTAEQTSRLRFAAHATGTDIEGLGTGMRFLAKNMNVGSPAFKQLGVQVRDTHGKLLDVDRVLPQLADKFAAMPNGPQKTALALKLFGKQGTSLIPLLNKGSKGLAAFAKQSDALGSTMSGKDLDAIRANAVAHREFHAAMTGLGITLGRVLLPWLTRLAELTNAKVIPAVQKLGGWVRDTLSPAIDTFVKQYGPSFIALFKAFADTISGLLPDLQTTGASMSPMLDGLDRLARWLSANNPRAETARRTILGLAAGFVALSAVDKAVRTVDSAIGRVKGFADAAKRITTTVVGVRDRASKKLDAIKAKVAAIRSKQVTVDVETKTTESGQAAGKRFGLDALKGFGQGLAQGGGIAAALSALLPEEFAIPVAGWIAAGVTLAAALIFAFRTPLANFFTKQLPSWLTTTLPHTILPAITGFIASIPGRLAFLAGMVVGLLVVAVVKGIPALLAVLGRLALVVLRAVGRFLDGVVAWFAALPGRIARAISSLLGIIGRIVGQIVAFFAALPGRVVAILVKLPGQIWTAIRNAPAFFRRVVDAAADFFAKLPGRIIGFLRKLPGDIWNAIKSIPGYFGRAFDALIVKVRTPLNAAIGLLNHFIDGINAVITKFGMDRIGHIPLVGTSSGGTSTKTFGAKGTTRRAFAGGGLLRGPGTATSDSIPAWLSTGEYVLRAKAVRAVGTRTLDQLNAQGMASGGLVGGSLLAKGTDWVIDHLAGPTVAAIRHRIGGLLGGLTGGLVGRLATAIKAALAKLGPTLGGPGGFTGGGSAAANRALGQRMAAAVGWTGAQWAALNRLVMSESGWSTTATNPSSGAYGIPQALPASKLASAGADWRTNAATQIRWLLGYVRDRYVTPANAWAFHLAHGWYRHGGLVRSYDAGGFLPRGLSLAYNGTGRPEPVGAGTTYQITVNVAPTANQAEIGRELVTAIRSYEQRNGTGWRR